MNALEYAEHIGCTDALERADLSDLERLLLTLTSVRVNRRLRRALGRCRTDTRRPEHEIELNSRILGHQAHRETFLHEIGHALTPLERGHGQAFRAVCARLGADPSPRAQTGLVTVQRRVVARCDRCGHQFRRARAFARNRSWQHGGGCGGELVPVERSAT